MKGPTRTREGATLWSFTSEKSLHAACQGHAKLCQM